MKQLRKAILALCGRMELNAEGPCVRLCVRGGGEGWVLLLLVRDLGIWPGEFLGNEPRVPWATRASAHVGLPRPRVDAKVVMHTAGYCTTEPSWMPLEPPLPPFGHCCCAARWMHCLGGCAYLPGSCRCSALTKKTFEQVVWVLRRSSGKWANELDKPTRALDFAIFPANLPPK